MSVATETTAPAPAASPRVALLSNGEYHVMVTEAGGGYSAWRDMDVTRWREDGTQDCWGQFIYLHDGVSDATWSVGLQPTCRPGDSQNQAFGASRASFSRTDHSVAVQCDIAVAPDQPVEVRLLKLTNLGSVAREVAVTSYAEVVLLPRRADHAHPAFAKLFLETEWLPTHRALLCRRRPRAAHDQPFWAVHILADEAGAGAPKGIEWETDRLRFLGRGRTPADPAALATGATLSGTTGPVLDPIFSLRRRLRVAAGEIKRVAFATGAAATRDDALAIAFRYCNISAAQAALEGADRQAASRLAQQQVAPADGALYQRLAAAIIYPNARWRDADAMAKNQLGQPGLWPLAISGDKPIVLALVSADQAAFVDDCLKAHGFLRASGLSFDLVIQSTTPERVEPVLAHRVEPSLRKKPGGVFLLDANKLSEPDRLLLAAAARVVLNGAVGSLRQAL